MKKNLLFMFLAILFIIAVLLIGIGPKQFYYKVLYLGDRIKVDTTVYIDGEKKEIDKDSIEINGDGIGKKTINVKDNKFNLSFKGNKYSLYTIDFKVGEYNFRIGMAHLNWWDINKYTVTINVDTKNKTVSFHSNTTYIDEKTAAEESYEIEDSDKLEDINIISITAF